MTNSPFAHPTPISGHEDPTDGPAWVMQLVLCLDKNDPPTRTSVCEAAATAVVTLLDDPRALPGGVWHEDVQQWLNGRIRKHCRRAKPSVFDQLHDLPGASATSRDAQVRAFVPTPMDAIARPLAKLQLSGSELDDPDAVSVADSTTCAPVVISIAPQPFLPLGKAAAAAAHAAQLTAAAMTPAQLQQWRSSSFRVSVEHPTSAQWATLTTSAPVVVVDAGLTVVEPGTATATARWA